MLENIRLSFQGIWSHKLRSFLTMLGIIIGIAAIIAIVSTIKGTNEQIKKNLVGSGNNTVEITLNQYSSDYDFEYSSMPEGIPVVSDEVYDEILAIDEVENVALFTRRQYSDQIFFKSSSYSGQVLGIDANYFNTCDYIVTKGRGFDTEDYRGFRKVAIIHKDVAASLFQNEDPIGQTIEIKGEPFIVIGIVDKSSAFEPVINSLEDYYTYAGNSSGQIFLPSGVWPISYKYDEPQHLMIKAVDTDSMSAAGKKSAEILNSYITSDISSDNEEIVKYRAADLLEKAKNLQELNQSINQQLLWIASISLLVGGIGVMNIMLVSVTERTSEIGLKKAVGARKSKILIQFLTEAAVLTSFGGILGILTGIGLAQIISRISETPVAISVPAIVGSVVFSVLIGLIFGLLPSYKAANLNPIEALRRE